MPKPTKAALAKHLYAVVLLASPVNAVGVQVDHDYEWFDTVEGQQLFMSETLTWAQEDVDTHGDLVHLIAALDRTAPTLSIKESVVFRNGDDEALVKAADEWHEKVLADPELLVSKPVSRAATPAATGPKGAPKVKPKVKGRKPTAAAAVLNQDADEQVEDQAGKADALKKRLAAKAAKPAAEGEKAEPEQPMTWAIPVNRRARLLKRA